MILQRKINANQTRLERTKTMSEMKEKYYKKFRKINDVEMLKDYQQFKMQYNGDYVKWRNLLKSSLVIFTIHFLLLVIVL